VKIRFVWVCVTVACLVSAAPAIGANQTVAANEFSQFVPKHVAVNVGEMVTWNNMGNGLHNVHFDDNSFQQPPFADASAWSVSKTFPTPGVYGYHCDVHGNTGGVGMSGTVTVNGPSYPRPKGATPIRVPLTMAFKPCASPNRTHGPPLASPSCSGPVPESAWLTVGTPDANGAAANSSGSLSLTTQVGNPSTTADEADVLVISSLTDVRNKAGLTDYTGQLQARIALRLTDRNTQPSLNEPSTGDTTFNITVPCAGTASTTIGSTCSVTTTADAIIPGMVPEGKRSVWQVGKVDVYDGGPDGVVSTNDNTLFADQGIFVP
jgi:plastocyanin